MKRQCFTCNKTQSVESHMFNFGKCLSCGSNDTSHDIVSEKEMLAHLRLVRDSEPEIWDSLMKTETGACIMKLWDRLR
jgi:hypothetical protein